MNNQLNQANICPRSKFSGLCSGKVPMELHCLEQVGKMGGHLSNMLLCRKKPVYLHKHIFWCSCLLKEFFLRGAQLTVVFMDKCLYMLQKDPGVEKEIIFSPPQQAMHIARVSKEWKARRQKKNANKIYFITIWPPTANQRCNSICPYSKVPF